MTAPSQQESAARTAPQPVSFREALRYWTKLGFISFGGPTGQIAMMHQELVDRRRWISERRFLHALNYAMVLPGPEAQQLATYIGWLMHGTWGGIAAGVLFLLPSFCLLVLLSWIYVVYGETPGVAAALYGVKPAVTAIVAFAAWRIGSRTLGNWVLRGIAVLAFLALFAFNAPFPLIVLCAALAGIIGGRISPSHFSAAVAHASQAGTHAPALIDDQTPAVSMPMRRLVLVLVIGLSLWAGAMLLTARLGDTATLTHIGWFFTKAALLTFGGAYAVLPYVYQGAVVTFGWLTPAQMIDGLALGETTPGPLIMIVAFVGFVGAHGQQVFGPDLQTIAGVAGASVAAFFTFLPSFIFILVGAPLVEATRNEMRLTAPLTGITAAVSGVVINLAVFFAWHVLWPRGMSGSFDPIAAVIMAASAVALFRFGMGVVPLIAWSATAGLAVGWLGPLLF